MKDHKIKIRKQINFYLNNCIYNQFWIQFTYDSWANLNYELERKFKFQLWEQLEEQIKESLK